MTAELETPIAKFTIQPISYPVLREEIIALVSECMSITVSSADDEDGLKLAKSKRKELRNVRLAVEKRREKLKSESLEYGRRVDWAAKALTDPILPAEAYLKDQESIVQREKERIEKEAEERRNAMIHQRLSLMAEAGRVCVATDVSYLSEEEFQADLAKAVEAKRLRDEQAAAEEAERLRIAEQNRIEAEKLAAERAELERQRTEQAEAQRLIDMENKRIADAAEAVRIAADIEQARRFAAEAARLEAIAEQERKAAEAKAQAEAEEVERKRQAELRPDREKIAAFADAVTKLEIPTLSPKSKAIAGEIAQVMLDASAKIRAAGSKLK